MSATADPTQPPFLSGTNTLKSQLRRADRKRKLWALALIAPMFIFLVVGFIVPIASLLKLSVEDLEVGEALPRTVEAFDAWDGEGYPPPEALEIFAEELVIADENKTLGSATRRLNYAFSGFKSMLKKTGREAEEKLVGVPSDQILDAFIAIDKNWAKPGYWLAIKDAVGPLSDFYFLWAVDRVRDEAGDIVSRPSDQSIYLDVLGRTLEISIAVTAICFLLGLPIAYLLATLPPSKSNLLLILVLLPFWTSLLVRTTAWIVLLQNQGLINDLGILLGFWDEPLELIRNRIGVYIAMVHIQLPFMILPIYAVMKGINPWHMRAAESLGAHRWLAFLKVYLPQCLPGIGAGILLCFILSLGYYITPALVGGPQDQMISFWIVENMGRVLNWGLAAALSVILLGITLIFFFIYNRFVGFDKLRMG